MPGEADYLSDPRPERLRAALTALAEFHLASASFPIAENRPVLSPGILARQERLRALEQGGLDRLEGAMAVGGWPEFEDLARRLTTLFPRAAPDIGARLGAAAQFDVQLQPCVGDIWHDHVLFEDARVTGLVDFGAMKPENVAIDVARLLGSMAGNDISGWQDGLAAYEAVRTISRAERSLVIAFDLSGVLLSGFNWIEWIYVDRRMFENRPAILQRLDGLVARLEGLVDMEP